MTYFPEECIVALAVIFIRHNDNPIRLTVLCRQVLQYPILELVWKVYDMYAWNRLSWALADFVIGFIGSDKNTRKLWMNN